MSTEDQQFYFVEFDIRKIPSNEVKQKFKQNDHLYTAHEEFKKIGVTYFKRDSSLWKSEEINNELFNGMRVVPYGMRITSDYFNRLYTVCANKNKYVKNLNKRSNG